MMKSVAKAYIKAAMESEYGFAPAMRDIQLGKATDDSNRVHISFSVKGHEYKFDSFHNYAKDGFDLGVWTGAGTIKAA